MFSATHIAILAASPLFRGVAPDAVAEEVRAATREGVVEFAAHAVGIGGDGVLYVVPLPVEGGVDIDVTLLVEEGFFAVGGAYRPLRAWLCGGECLSLRRTPAGGNDSLCPRGGMREGCCYTLRRLLGACSLTNRT